MEWNPTQFFREDESIQPHPFVLLVLNHPINETALAILRKHGMPYIPLPICTPVNIHCERIEYSVEIYRYMF